MDRNAALEKARLAPKGERKDLYTKWCENNTRKTAIDAMCCDCMGGPSQTNLRNLIRDCVSKPTSSHPCPLYAWRPYK